MSAKKTIVIAFLYVLPLLAGCDAALTMGGRTVGVREGRFIFTDGYLQRDYDAPFDRVWSACEKAMADLKADEVEKNRRISAGTISGVVEEEKCRVVVEYLSKNQTSVAVRVGMAGNNLASQLIHERIAGNLVQP